MIEKDHESLSISRQCELLGVPRSTYYYQPIQETEYNLMLMRELDMLYLDSPSFGSRMMTASLNRKGFQVNRKRVSRLMKAMCIEALYSKPRPRTTIPGVIKFPYLLSSMNICYSNQAWGTDITYIPVKGGFIYLVAYLDLYSRYILSWKLSNTLESQFCIEALKNALEQGFPEVINSDQGIQFTSHAYVDLVIRSGAKVSMAGRGSCWNNILSERFWRTLKYDEVYLKQYDNSCEAHKNIGDFIHFYNINRPHSSLNYKTPIEVYLGKST